MSERANAIVNKKWFRAYWALFLLLCILLIESLFKSGVALGTVIWFVLAQTAAISFAKYSTGRINKKALLLCVPIGLINAGHLLFYSTSVQIITWPAALVLFALQLTYLSRPEKEKISEWFDFRNTVDFLNTVFANAFVYISYPFKGLFNFTKEKNKSVVRQVFIGILIAIPIVGIFIVLFARADQSFTKMLGNFSEGLFSNFGVLIVDLIIGAILCIFVSAAFVGANARESTTEPSQKEIKEVNNITLSTILIMVSIIITSYVVLQLNHWFGNVPKNYYQMDEFSKSARTGFFELVVASCFLLTLIAVVTKISTKRDQRIVPLIKAPLILLCACNLIVLYSAVEKMVIYVGRSGITSKRILVLWFAIIIAACTAGVFIKIIRYSFKLFTFCSLAVIALVCVLSFCNMDYYVAKNHIYLAEHHQIQNLEEDVLSVLSYAAAEPIAEYKNRIKNGTSANQTTKKQSQKEVLKILEQELVRHQKNVNRLSKNNPVMGFNFSRLRAQNAISSFE